MKTTKITLLLMLSCILLTSCLESYRDVSALSDRHFAQHSNYKALDANVYSGNWYLSDEFGHISEQLLRVQRQPWVTLSNWYLLDSWGGRSVQQSYQLQHQLNGDVFYLDYTLSEQFFLYWQEYHFYEKVLDISDQWGGYRGDMQLVNAYNWDFDLYLDYQHIQIKSINEYAPQAIDAEKQLQIVVNDQLQAKVVMGYPYGDYRPYDLYSIQGLTMDEQEQLLVVLSIYEQFIQTYQQL